MPSNSQHYSLHLSPHPDAPLLLKLFDSLPSTTTTSSSPNLLIPLYSDSLNLGMDQVESLLETGVSNYNRTSHRVLPKPSATASSPVQPQRHSSLVPTPSLSPINLILKDVQAVSSSKDDNTSTSVINLIFRADPVLFSSLLHKVFPTHPTSTSSSSVVLSIPIDEGVEGGAAGVLKKLKEEGVITTSGDGVVSQELGLKEMVLVRGKTSVWETRKVSLE